MSRLCSRIGDCTGRRPGAGIVHTSIDLPRPVYQRRRESAFTTDQKVHDVVMEGTDAALRKYGHPSVSQLKGSPVKGEVEAWPFTALDASLPPTAEGR